MIVVAMFIFLLIAIPIGLIIYILLGTSTHYDLSQARVRKYIADKNSKVHPGKKDGV